jgi:hypothetical protein
VSSRLSLRIIDCPDRRLAKAAAEFALEATDGGKTEVNVLIPRVVHARIWHRLLHDRTSDVLAGALSQVPHVTVTFVPYHLGRVPSEVALAGPVLATNGHRPGAAPLADGVRPIAEAAWRDTVTVEGTVMEGVVEPVGGAGRSCVVILNDGSGRLGLAFLGREHVAGLDLGARVRATGRVGDHRRQLALLNPEYTIVEPAVDPSVHVAPDHH